MEKKKKVDLTKCVCHKSSQKNYNTYPVAQVTYYDDDDDAYRSYWSRFGVTM